MSVVCGDIELVAAAAFWMMIFGAEGGGGFTAGGLPCGGVLVKMMNILLVVCKFDNIATGACQFCTGLYSYSQGSQVLHL